MDIKPFLKLMVDKGASDLYFSTGAPVSLRVDGVTHPITDTPLPPGTVKDIAYSLMRADQVTAFEEELEMDLSTAAQDIGRFRINVFRQRGEAAMVVRHIKDRIPSVEELNLPSLLRELVMHPRGLVLVVGTTGSGKSTTLASMVDHRNSHATGHILTIEDPIEYLHEHKKSIVNQREIGLDTLSYGSALRRAMREAPDVIMIGEIRDRETMEQAMLYAQTGHLCLSTLHATNASQTLERIGSFFPQSSHHELFMDLASILRGIICQRLLTGLDGKRIPAVELLTATPYVRELIQKGRFDQIGEAMEKSPERGMQTFDQSLYKLYKAGRVSREEALNNADSPNNLNLKIRLAGDQEAESAL